MASWGALLTIACLVVLAMQRASSRLTVLAWVPFPRLSSALHARLQEECNPWLAGPESPLLPLDAAEGDTASGASTLEGATESDWDASFPAAANASGGELLESQGLPEFTASDGVAVAGFLALMSSLSEGLPEAVALLQASPLPRAPQLAVQAEEAVRVLSDVLTKQGAAAPPGALGVLAFLVSSAALLRLGGEGATPQLPGAAAFLDAMQHLGDAVAALVSGNKTASRAWTASEVAAVLAASDAVQPKPEDLAGEAAAPASGNLTSADPGLFVQVFGGEVAAWRVLKSASEVLRATARWRPQDLVQAVAEQAALRFPVAALQVGELEDRLGLDVLAASGRREGGGWRLPFTVQLYRRNEGRHLHRLAVCRRLLFNSVLGIREFDDEAQQLYEERARLVFRNLELFPEHRGLRVEARLVGASGVAGVWHELPPSDRDGRVEASLFSSAEEVAAVAGRGGGSAAGVAVEVRLADRPLAPVSSALLPLVEPTGLTVVSDIDDTVKVTEVFRGAGRMLENTFLRPFQAVQGMAAVYRTWARKYGASFEYVSKSPPELHQPLTDFLVAEGFPAAAVHLCSIWSHERATFKERRVEALLEEFPERKFVLVGDSGEHDAAIYASIARRHPDRIAMVLIRQVSKQHPVDPSVMQGVDLAKWHVFEDPAELPLDLPVTLPAALGPLTLSAFPGVPAMDELFASVPAVMATAVHAQANLREWAR